MTGLAGEREQKGLLGSFMVLDLGGKGVMGYVYA